MNALIVLAHPEPDSFNAHLAAFAHATLRRAGHHARIVDLYAQGFDPREAGAHFADRADPLRFDAQIEQRHHAQRGRLPADVREQLDHLAWADLLVLQFPLWWFAPPAMLKGWMDRVFVYGDAYSSTQRFDQGRFRGRHALLCVTTGSSAAACGPDGREGDTRLILWPTAHALRYLGYTVLEPLLLHGVRAGLRGERAAQRDRQLQRTMTQFGETLCAPQRAACVPFNGDGDWTADGRLKPDAPSHGPFIRHVA